MNRQQGGSVAAGSNQLVYKQYVRVGETLSNGYKLVDVQREKVTLQRGSDKLELTIEEASKNAPATARQQNRGNRQINNTTRILQTMQNMQRMQMFQNFQMMRMMNNNRPDMNNNNNNKGLHGNLWVNRAGIHQNPVVSQAAIRHNRSLRSLLFRLPFDSRQNLM